MNRLIGEKFLDGETVLKTREWKGIESNPCHKCYYDGTTKASCKKSNKLHGDCKGKIFTPCTRVGSWLFRWFGV